MTLISSVQQFGLKIKEEDLIEINALRLGKQYKDEEEETYLTGSCEKKPLTTSPFVRYLSTMAKLRMVIGHTSIWFSKSKTVLIALDIYTPSSTEWS